MNQILVTDKLYVTPEFKRKRKLYKVQFFLSVFFICLLFSYYIYAEHDRNKSEEVSQELLVQMAYSNADRTIKPPDEYDVIRVILKDETELEEVVVEEPEEIEEEETTTYVASNGVEYTIESTINIPSLGINYPVLADTSEALLEISVNKYWGPKPNEVGNYCIVGHNYRNDKMFSLLNTIQNGDIVELTDMSGRTISYKVYNQYVVEPTDTRCTSQLTNGRKELTLITCTNYGKQRLVVKCREVK